MLVLTRKKEERIHIGPNITVTVLRVTGHTVKIGIDAPTDVHILRGELRHVAENAPLKSNPLHQP